MINTIEKEKAIGARNAICSCKQATNKVFLSGLLAVACFFVGTPQSASAFEFKLPSFGGGLKFEVADQAAVSINDVKRIAVLPFIYKGKEDAITTDDVLTVLGSVRVNGEQFFSVYERKRLNDFISEIRLGSSGLTSPKNALRLGKMAQVDGVVYGTVTQSSTKVSRIRVKVKECIQTSSGDTKTSVIMNEGLCLKKAKVPTNCEVTTAAYSFNPKIAVVETGAVRTVGSMSGTASEKYCGVGAQKSAEELLRKARSAAVKDFRNNITPRTKTYTVKVLKKFCKKKAKPNCDASTPDKSIPRAIDAGYKFAKTKRLDRACGFWVPAFEQHSEGFVTPYWAGVCAEFLENDFEKAEGLYKLADRTLMEPVAAVNDALARIRERKNTKATQSQSKPRASRPARKPDPVAKEMQKLLNESGYDAGPEDGFPGKRTRAALKEFQSDNGLGATGKLDGDTKAMLGMGE